MPNAPLLLEEEEELNAPLLRELDAALLRDPLLLEERDEELNAPLLLELTYNTDSN